MRLLRRLDRADAAAAAVVAAEGIPVSISWSSGETRVQAAALLAGEMIACDVTIHSYVGGVPSVTSAERVTRDESDIGWILDPLGVRLGRVVSIDGRLMEWELFAPEAERRRAAVARACNNVGECALTGGAGPVL